MKRIFTLLIALFSLTAVFAQQGYRNDYSRDHRTSTDVYQRNNSYNSYNTYDHHNADWNDHSNYGREDGIRRDYDDRRRDYDRDRRYNDRVIYSQPRSTNFGTVAGALIIGGILGAILTH